MPCPQHSGRGRSWRLREPCLRRHAPSARILASQLPAAGLEHIGFLQPQPRAQKRCSPVGRRRGETPTRTWDPQLGLPRGPSLPPRTPGIGGYGRTASLRRVCPA